MRKLVDAETVPLRGGAITVREPALLPFGAFSMAQNVRPTRPGFIKRPGQIAQHTQADSTNQVITLYQFRKGKIDEAHIFAQMGDDDVLEATTAPPGITAGAFGSQVFSGSASSIPASWANVSDIMLFSNGVDQHQIYGGESSYVTKFIVFKGAADPKNVPELGLDYSDEVTDGNLTGTVAVLNSLSTWANWDCVYICTPVPADALYLTVVNANANASVLTLYYWANDNDWSDTGATGTITETPCLAASGTIAWSSPSAAGGAGDEVPTTMFGVTGFWYQIRLSGAIDSTVSISNCTFQSPWTSLVNVWDSVPLDAIEVMVETGSGTGIFDTYGAGAVDVDTLASGSKVVIASTDPLEGIYIDVGSTPHTGTAPTITCKYWDGDSFETVGTVNDSTDGLYHSGWLRFPQQSAVQPVMFQGTQYYAYWYELTFNQNLTDDMIIGIQCMPYFSIDDFGVKGQCCAAWREHACYTFAQYPEYVYISASNQPLVLNGFEFGILEAGDGRSNPVRCMQPFFNNLLVWQQEKGVEGGCTTIFQGYDPTTYGKLLLSSKVGIMNSKSAAVVEGVLTAGQTDDQFSAKSSLAFWISRYGVCSTNGRTVWIISDDIQNYFDPTQSECIRRGCEAESWLEHDSTYNILRLGLVSGEPLMTSTATSTSASKLVDTAGAFTTRKTVTGHPISGTIAIGDTVYNTTDGTTALVTAIDSATQLSLDTDIMTSGEAYKILSGTPNLYPIFDLADKVWYFDFFAQSLSCIKEVEAGSGQLPITHIGGGVADGQVYVLNSGQNDVSTAINSYLDMELDYKGQYIALVEFLLRCKAQAAGDLTITFDANEVQAAQFTLSMVAELATQGIRRHRVSVNVVDQHITIRIQHNTASQNVYLEDIGLGVELWEGR